MPAGDYFEPRLLRLTGIQPLQQALGPDRRLVCGAGKGVGDALAKRAVGHERLAITIKVMPPHVDAAAREDLEPHGVRVELPDAPPKQPLHAPRSLDVRVDVNRLREVDVPPGAPPERVNEVVRILRTEPGKDDGGFVGDTVTGGVLEVQQLG